MGIYHYIYHRIFSGDYPPKQGSWVSYLKMLIGLRP